MLLFIIICVVLLQMIDFELLLLCRINDCSNENRPLARSRDIILSSNVNGVSGYDMAL